MATVIDSPVSAQEEPPTRIVSRELPNLRNTVVAAEYRRQRAVLNTSVEAQHEELEFWESAQTHEGWD